MINSIIRLVKKSPFLYNLAKKVNRMLNPKAFISSAPETDLIFYAYILKSPDELATIRKKYQGLQKYNTKLFILVDNPNYNIILHKLIRENPDICFASSNYFERYHKKLSNNKIIWLNYTESQSKLLDYLA